MLVKSYSYEINREYNCLYIFVQNKYGAGKKESIKQYKYDIIHAIYSSKAKLGTKLGISD